MYWEVAQRSSPGQQGLQLLPCISGLLCLTIQLVEDSAGQAVRRYQLKQHPYILHLCSISKGVCVLNSVLRTCWSICEGVCFTNEVAVVEVASRHASEQHVTVWVVTSTYCSCASRGSTRPTKWWHRMSDEPCSSFWTNHRPLTPGQADVCSDETAMPPMCHK